MQQQIPIPTETVVLRTKPEELVIAEVVNGTAAATFIAGGIGAAALGLIIPLSEAIPTLKTALTFNAEVGSLSGKTIVATLIYLVAWAVFGTLLRGKNVSMRTAMIVAFIGMTIGLLGTFPPIFELFTAH